MGLLGGFRGCRFNGTMYNVVGPSLVAMATKFGQTIAYNSACMADTRDVCTYHGVFGNGQFNGTTQNVEGPTLVAMATTFGLGAEIQSPTDLSVYLSVERPSE